MPVARSQSTTPARGAQSLRVCHLITGFDTGGAERILFQTARRLDPSRFSSFVVSLRSPRRMPPGAQRSGLEIIHLGKGRRIGPSTVWRLARLLRSRDVDVVHAYLYHASIAGRLAGRMARVPVVVTSTRASLSYLPAAAWWLDRVTARWCQKVIAVSRGTADFVIEREGIPREKVLVIPNGVDLGRFRPGNRAVARADLGVSDDAFLVACIGRLHAQKGHTYLLEALAAVQSAIPGLVCVIAGEGPLRSALEADANRRGLGGVCRFLGLREPIQPVYDAADVTVLASLYEGMPNVVLEAMAMGCPVVATRVEGSVELVEAGVTGFLVPPANGAALGQALLALAGEPGRATAMRAAARATAERSLGIDRMVRAVESVYTTEWEAATRHRERL